jgi:putative flippase GtrA
MTVSIDYFTYVALLFYLTKVNIAKFFGFALGTIFSFLANRNITFNNKNYFWLHLGKFSLLYFVSLNINIYLNDFLLEIFINNSFKFLVSFVFATVCSACINFMGMRYFVFK